MLDFISISPVSVDASHDNKYKRDKRESRRLPGRLCQGNSWEKKISRMIFFCSVLFLVLVSFSS